MGEATRAIQGYPTQVWVRAVNGKPTIENVALLHDRILTDDKDTFFIPGNRPDRLLGPSKESYQIALDGMTRRLRIPDAVLWKNHGGPCEARGADYRKVDEEIMGLVYRAFESAPGRPVIIPQKWLDTNHDYMGPFDYPLDQPNEYGYPKLRPMDPELLSGLSDL